VPIQELKRRAFDQAVRAGPRGLAPAAGADPVGRFVSREHVADADDAAVGVADHGEPFEREWRPGGCGCVGSRNYICPSRGSVRPLRADISAVVLVRLVTRRGGETVAAEEF
jgi:hypothetical protein